MDRQWCDELTCILFLAIGTMCLMNGYDTQSFIVESVLHSVHMREPGTIAKHAGYYGQAVLYAAYALATLFAPWICYRVGSKWSLFAGSLLFTMYQAGFFMLNSYYYYLSQALMGIGFACQLLDTAREPKMLLLSFFFLFYGFHVSYWLVAYPTTFAFSKMLSTNIYLPAYYSAMIGLGNIIGEFNL
ncbi:hypothetical protein TELCIR_02377 [Teladorsagia circumcincta]|uniref:Uncharacterized protein n=1 Tax=Teladorsagia circumcincta TaxID=45464 RepID=A0A2G9UZB3_TELCI|nr:hypothetical protein TELCIR_02377 [Teladorsagia circumcincta]